MSKHFRKIRKSLGKSQMEIAVIAGVSIPLVSRLESGVTQWANLQSRTRQALAAAYGVDVLTGVAVESPEKTNPSVDVREPASSATS